MRLDLVVSECDTCHRGEQDVADFDFDPRTGVALLDFAWPLWETWEKMTTAEEAIFLVETTIGQLCGDPVRAIEAFRQTESRFGYEDVLMRMIRFLAKLKQYPQAEIKTWNPADG